MKAASAIARTGNSAVRRNVPHVAEKAWHKVNLPLLILIAFIPLQNIYLGKFPSLGGGINFINVMLILSIMTWKFRADLTAPTRTTVGKLLFVYICIYFFSTIYALITLGPIRDGSLFHMLKDIIVGMLFYYLVLNSVRDYRGIVYTILATFMPLPYMFRVFYTQLQGVLSANYDDSLRTVSGTFMELGSNEIAAFYASYTMIILALIIYIKDVRIRAGLLLLAVTNIYCAVYAYSRGAYLAMLLGLAVLFWQVNKKLAVIGIVSILVFGAALSPFFPNSVQQRFGSIFADEGQRDRSAESRFVLWGLAMDQFKKSPIVGIGFKSFRRVGRTGQDTHNYFVKVLTEQGIIGLLCLLAIIWCAWQASRKLVQRAKEPLYKALGAGMLGCIAVVSLGSAFGDRFTHYPLISYFWVYLALVHRALFLSDDQQDVRDKLGS